MNRVFYKFHYWLLCLLLTSMSVTLMTGCNKVDFNNSEREEVLNVLRSYRDAVTAKDGEKAIQFVSADSIERIADFLDWALHDTPEQLRQRDLFEQIQVLSIRNNIDAESLPNLSPEKLLIELINSGAFSTKLLEAARFGNSIFYPERKICYVALYDQHLPTKNRITCIEDPDGWRVHLLGNEGLEMNAYRKIMEEKEISETELIDQIVKSWTAGESPEKLWQPVVKS